MLHIKKLPSLFRFSLASLIVALAVSLAGCDSKEDKSDDDDDDVGDDDDDTGTGDDNPGDDDDNPGDDDDATGDDDDSTGDGWDMLGECRLFGAGQWADGKYTGTVEYLLLADNGDGDELCRLKFDVTTVGEPAMPCDFCYWSTVVKLSNPTVVTDIEGTCADSDRGLDEAGIMALMQPSTGMGFAEEATGHGQILVHYDESTMTWAAAAFGVWDEDAGELSYDKVEGFCWY